MISKSKLGFLWLLLTLLSILPLQARQIGDSTKVTLAVMDFKNNSGVFGYDRLERALPEMLKTELSRSPEILVVERSKIESILKEQALAQAGIIENETAQQVGRLAGAEFIITGEINRIGNQLRIDAHLLKVATAQISGEKITGRSAEHIEPMVKLLANNLIFNLTGNGERKSFSKIQNYSPNWALATTATLAAASMFLHFNYKSNYDRYHENDQLEKFDPYYSDANRYYKARNIGLIASGIAAIATFSLWQKDRAEENKIHASSQFQRDQQIWAAVAVQHHNYRFTIGIGF